MVMILYCTIRLKRLKHMERGILGIVSGRIIGITELNTIRRHPILKEVKSNGRYNRENA